MRQWLSGWGSALATEWEYFFGGFRECCAVNAPHTYFPCEQCALYESRFFSKRFEKCIANCNFLFAERKVSISVGVPKPTIADLDAIF